MKNNVRNPWKDAEKIIAGIQSPKILDRDFPLEDFATDLENNFHLAIKTAIQACADAGGGRVVVPTGRFLCRGPIHLQSGVELHLSDGAYIKFSPEPNDYLPMVYCRWEGVNLYNYSPMIYAKDAEDLAITGKGVLDGGAEIWSTWRRGQRDSRHEAWRVGADAVPLEERQFGPDYKLRPPMMHLVNCQRVLIEDIMLTNASFWMIHPVYSEHITIRNVHCHSMFINNDGIDIDSCAEVLIEDSRFSTGDDAIVMKSGRDRDGWETGIPTRNVVVRNCEVPEVRNGFAIGSELSGGVENVYFDNLKIGKVQGVTICFKANKDRGGKIRNVHVRNVEVEHGGDLLLEFTNDYHSYKGGDAPTVFETITVENLRCGYAKTALSLHGLEEQPIRDVHLKDIHVTESPCPVSCQKNYEDVTLENVTVNGGDVHLARGET